MDFKWSELRYNDWDKDLLDLYQNKVDHGNALIDDLFNEESAIFLEEKTKLLVQKLKKFNSESKDWVAKNLEISSNKRKSKSTFMILSLLLGGLGIQKAYIGHWGYFFLSLVFSFTFIPAIIGLYDFVKTLFTSVDKFDSKFNKDYTYYNQFTFISDIDLDDNVTENQIVNDKETKESKTSPEIKAAEMEVKKYEDALNEIDSSSQKGKADKSLLEGALNSARSKLKQLRENN